MFFLDGGNGFVVYIYIYDFSFWNCCSDVSGGISLWRIRYVKDRYMFNLWISRQWGDLDFLRCISSVYKMYLYGSKKHSGEIERRTGPNMSKEVSLISFWSGTWISWIIEPTTRRCRFLSTNVRTSLRHNNFRTRRGGRESFARKKPVKIWDPNNWRYFDHFKKNFRIQNLGRCFEDFKKNMKW